MLPLLAALVPLFGKVRAPDSLVLSPSTIANDYAGALDLTITGLDSAGQTVVVEEYLDADGSSTINAGDVLLRKLNVTDGQVTSIAGVRNLNIPGDEDLVANSQIHTRLLYSASDITGRVDGLHIFRVSPSGAGFAPFTTNFSVTQRDYAGSGISGSVVAGGPQPGALVLVQAAGGDGNLFAITTAGAGGNYSIKTPPGRYQIIAAKSGFVFNTSTSPVITVPAGSFATGQTETLVASQRTISGKLRDGSTLAGLPGVAMEGGSQTGFVSVAFTDGSGDYVMDATTEAWKINAEQSAVARFGCVTLNITEPSAVTVTGFNLDMPHANSLIYGSVRTPVNVPVPFVSIRGETNGSPNYKAAGVTDAAGNYAMGVTIGSWRVNVEPTPGFLFQQQLTTVVNTNGSAVLQNLLAYPVTAHLRGQIRDNNNAIVANVKIYAADLTGVIGDSTTTADANGMFDLPVFGGGGVATRRWFLGLQFSNTSPTNYVPTSPNFDVQDGVDINNINYLVHVVTAHLFGQVQDENNAPIGNVSIFGNVTPNGIYNAGANVDGGGNFDLALFGGNWALGLSNIFGLGLIPQDFQISVTDNINQSGLIFRARHTTATISGTVMSATSMPIAGVTVFSTSTVGGANYNATAMTDMGGAYSLPVFSTTWAVGVNSTQLIAQGFSPVPNQNVFVNTGTVPVNFVAGPLATAVSRKLHGVTPFDISLPLTGTSGVECRTGGASNDYQVIVTFGGAVTFNNASLSSGTGSVSGTSGSGTASITVNLTGVTSGQRLTVLVAGVNEGGNIFDVSVPMGVLIGDTNGNGTVSGSDVAQTKAQSGNAASAGNFRTDVNANGAINGSDVSIVKSRSGNVLPP